MLGRELTDTDFAILDLSSKNCAKLEVAIRPFACSTGPLPLLDQPGRQP